MRNRRTDTTKGQVILVGLTSRDLARLGPGAQQQLLRKLGQTPAVKAAKYRNKKTAVVMPNGTTRTFDSRKEATRYGELLALLRAGKIHDLRLQVDFTLQEAYVTAEGEPVRAIRYRADFTYNAIQVVDFGMTIEDAKCDTGFVGLNRYKDHGVNRPLLAGEGGMLGELVYIHGTGWAKIVHVVEDVKGVKTSDYKLKKKLMQDKFGIGIKEV